MKRVISSAIDFDLFDLINEFARDKKVSRSEAVQMLLLYALNEIVPDAIKKDEDYSLEFDVETFV